MRLIHKLIMGFLLVSLLSGITGYYSADVSREILQKTFIETVESLAIEIFDEIENDLNNKVNIFREYSYDTFLQKEVLRSNEEFRKMKNVQEYIDNKDREWRSVPKEKITGFMLGLINNDISKTIRKKTGFYEDRNGYKVFPEVFITNIYGANIAQTGKTTDYRQDDEEWWQTARREGLYLGDAYDESADVYSVDIGLRIDDENGNPIGLMKVVVNIESILNLLEKTKSFGLHKEHKTMEYQITTKDGKLIYSTRTLDFLKDVSYLLPEESPMLKKEHSCVATLVRYDKGIFIVSAYSTKPGDIKQDWILVVRQGADELFAPVTRLKYQILTASLTVILVGIFIGFLISNSISRAFKKLIDATVRIGKGDLDTEIEVKSNDEIGQLGRAFKQMIEDLKTTTVKRDEMALEIVERKKAEDELKRAHREIEEWGMELEERFKDKTEELKTTYGQLFQAEKLSSLGQMAAGIAHELNSPLTGLISIIKNYRDKAKKGSDEYGHLSLMFEACEHMSQIINDFNAFSRKPETEHIEFDLIEVIESALILIMNQLKVKNILVTKE
ncbi:MAG TPA: HAMP domain-containing protein, partial [Nitrospirae bacterium]|nr:HAMP domain-containing protein [Nitrospirota bacterium]